MTNDDRNSPDSGSYVLDAMEPDERDDFEARLADSQDLRNEVTELTDTAVLLGMAVTPIAPPASLKQKIMARLSETPQLARETDAEEDATGAVAPVRRLHTVPPGSRGTVSSRARARWYRRPIVLVTAAAAAVILVTGAIFGTNIALQGANSSQQADALAAISSAPDVQRAAAAVSTGGTVTLVWSYHLGKSALIGKDLRSLPENKTYELWYITPTGKATDAGLFDSNGKNTLRVLTGHMAKGDTVGVTIEPAGGSMQPTTKPIVAIAAA